MSVLFWFALGMIAMRLIMFVSGRRRRPIPSLSTGAAAPAAQPMPVPQASAPAKKRVEPPRRHTFSAKRALAVAVASSAGLDTLEPVLDEIRVAAAEGRLSCTPRAMTEVHRLILFYIGYGLSSDGSVHWAGTERFGPDPMPGSTSVDFTLNQFIDGHLPEHPE